MKKIGFFFSILICSVFFAAAQNEGNIWYFGEYAGLDFNGGSPVALTNGMLNTMEGCASISDNNGDLLFYTDGMTVYNKSHILMPNGTGLLGHNSSTQSGVIVAKPGSTTLYYLFSVDGFSGTGGGLNYSEVDMTLQGGDGDINANKNIPIFPNACEKITAIKHQNNLDYWIVARLENSNTYHSYLLTSSGVNMTPVVTNIGPIYSDVIGYLKASQDGSKIAAANWTISDINLIDFDNSTGILSNIITFTHGGLAYGIEFSPSGDLLYAGDVSTGSIYQYNLLSSNIQSSEILLGSVPIYGTESAAALQLAPDNKIYIANLFAPHLSVIDNPNIIGVGCNFNPNGIHLDGKISQGGLPTFYSSIFVQTNNFSFNNPCFGDSAFFNFTNTSVDSVLWDFGDPNSGTSNSSTNTNPSHIFSDTGTFYISLYSYFNGMIDTVINDLFVTSIPVLDLGNDTVICDGETLTLDATLQNATYLWQDNSTSSSYTISTEGKYFVEITVDGCSNTDTINVIYSPLPQAIISGDYNICDGDQANINIIAAGFYPFEISYTNGTDTNMVYGNDSIIIEASQSGIYEITNVVDEFGCIGSYSGSSEVIINPCSLTVFIPNSFTPDNDLNNNNEGFIPSMHDINDVLTFNMKIFNRWGDVIYETTEKEKYWDGKFNNTLVQHGVYAYTITITDIYENSYNYNGHIFLIR